MKDKIEIGGDEVDFETMTDDEKLWTEYIDIQEKNIEQAKKNLMVYEAQKKMGQDMLNSL